MGRTTQIFVIQVDKRRAQIRFRRVGKEEAAASRHDSPPPIIRISRLLKSSWVGQLHDAVTTTTAIDEVSAGLRLRLVNQMNTMKSIIPCEETMSQVRDMRESRRALELRK